MLCCLKGWQQTLNCVGVVAEDHTSLLAGVMVLTWASISTAFNTSFIFPPSQMFPLAALLTKESVKRKRVRQTVQTTLTQLHALQTLPLQQGGSFISSSFTALSFSLAWYYSQSGTSIPHHRPGTT